MIEQNKPICGQRRGNYVCMCGLPPGHTGLEKDHKCLRPDLHSSANTTTWPRSKDDDCEPERKDFACKVCEQCGEVNGHKLGCKLAEVKERDPVADYGKGFDGQPIYPGEGFELASLADIVPVNARRFIECYVVDRWEREWLNAEYRGLIGLSCRSVMLKQPEVLAIRRKKVCKTCNGLGQVHYTKGTYTDLTRRMPCPDCKKKGGDEMQEPKFGSPQQRPESEGSPVGAFNQLPAQSVSSMPGSLADSPLEIAWTTFDEQSNQRGEKNAFISGWNAGKFQPKPQPPQPSVDPLCECGHRESEHKKNNVVCGCAHWFSQQGYCPCLEFKAVQSQPLQPSGEIHCAICGNKSTFLMQVMHPTCIYNLKEHQRCEALLKTIGKWKENDK